MSRVGRVDFLRWLPPPIEAWFPTLGAVGIAMVIAAVVSRIGERVLRRATRSSPMMASVLHDVRPAARLVLVLLLLQPVWHEAPTTLAGLSAVQRAASLLLIGAMTWLIVRAIQGVERAVITAHPLSVADNLEARRIHTQSRVLSRVVQGLVVLVGLSLLLMTFPAIRQVGTSLLASAGVVGIVAGFAARPVLGNLIAGLQIGLSQPIRIDDVVIVENEWGVIEEINGTYVVVRIWDQRRLIVPLQYWIEHPFQNWTHKSSELIGTVFLWVDYRMPLAPLREVLQSTCSASKHWDGRFALLQVTEAGEHSMQLRCLVTAASASAAWDLRCEVREALVDFIQKTCPEYLPRTRAELDVSRKPVAAAPPPPSTMPSSPAP